MRNVLIIGATSDIAQAIAKKYAAEGWGLTLASRNKQRLELFANDLRIRTATVRTVLFDALDFAAHQNFYDALEIRPDAVIAVFGYMGDQELARWDLNELRKTIDVNYTGMASILSIVANDFRKRGYGSIAGVSSVAGERGRQSNYVYGSAKAGLTAYLSGMRNLLASKGVHVMTVKPGFVWTRMTEDMELPAALTAEPEQIARAVFRGLEKKRNVIYTLWSWRWIMMAIRHIPESLFKRMKM